MDIVIESDFLCSKLSFQIFDMIMRLFRLNATTFHNSMRLASQNTGNSDSESSWRYTCLILRRLVSVTSYDQTGSYNGLCFSESASLLKQPFIMVPGKRVNAATFDWLMPYL